MPMSEDVMLCPLARIAYIDLVDLGFSACSMKEGMSSICTGFACLSEASEWAG